MKTLIVTLFLTVSVFATKSSLGGVESDSSQNRIGACRYECPTTGVFYNRAALCAEACSTTCEPVC